MKNATQTTKNRPISAWQHSTAHDNRAGKAEIRSFAECLVDAASRLAIVAFVEHVLELLGISPLYMPLLVVDVVSVSLQVLLLGTDFYGYALALLVVTVYAVKVLDRKFLLLEYETYMLRG